MRRTVSAEKKSGANITWIETMKQSKNPTSQIAICVDNFQYPVALELLKLYEVISDADAAADGDLRVIDESGEDYLYPASSFVLVDLPQNVERVVRDSFAHNHRIQSQLALP
jgi:hypothetical protein